MKVARLSQGIFAALAAQALLLPGPAFAQGALEEIVVTAARRATNVQDVPMAVSAFSAEALEVQNIENLQDVTSIVPNVLVRGVSGGAATTGVSINMRGIPDVGIYVDGIWQVSGAGLLQRPFVELERMEVLRGPQGTLYGRDSTGGSIHLFTETPQDEFGGLVNLGLGSFDRRDVSGAIDLPVTERFRTKWAVAHYERDGFIKSQVTGEDFGAFEDIVVRGDLFWEPTDRLAMRLIYQEDEITSTEGKVDTRIAPEVAWAQGVQVGIAEMFDIASGGRHNNLTAASGWPGGSVGEFENRTSFSEPALQNLEQVTFHVDYAVSDMIDFKYMYGGTRIENDAFWDYAGAEWVVYITHVTNLTELDSHEIQFTGSHGRLRWTAGAYSWDQTGKNRSFNYAASDWVQTPDAGRPKTLDYADVLASPACAASPADKGLDFGGDPSDPATWPQPCDGFFGNGQLDLLGFIVPGQGGAGMNTQKGEAYFGEVAFDITDRWDVTLGYRYHDQTNRSFSLDRAAGIAAGMTEPTPTFIGTRYSSVERALNLPIDPASAADPTRTVSFDQGSVRFASSFDVNDDVMVYLGYSEGFNSGGVDRYTDSVGEVIALYDPEIIENWEVGLRGDFMANRLRFNATYFNTDWIDIHLDAQVIDRATGQAATTLVTQNAATGEATGIDLELTYAATDNLTLGANLGFLDTQYVGFRPGVSVSESTAFAGAPDQTYNFSAMYEWSLSNGGSLMTRGSYSYTGEYERSPDPNFRLTSLDANADPLGGDFWMLNARAVYTPPAGNYEIAIYGNNLTNEFNRNSGWLHGLWTMDFATVDMPREYGLSLRMNF